MQNRQSTSSFHYSRTYTSLILLAELLRLAAEKKGGSTENLRPKDRRFSSLDAAVLATLPAYVRAQLSIHFTHRGAIDKKTIDLVSALTAGGLGFGFLAKVMKEQHYLEYLHTEMIYYHCMEAVQLRSTKAGQQSHHPLEASTLQQVHSVSATKGVSEGPKKQPTSRAGGRISSYFLGKETKKPAAIEKPVRKRHCRILIHSVKSDSGKLGS
jgi:hypothetical protein